MNIQCSIHEAVVWIPSRQLPMVCIFQTTFHPILWVIGVSAIVNPQAIVVRAERYNSVAIVIIRRSAGGMRL